jgi:hypothetical protein
VAAWGTNITGFTISTAPHPSSLRILDIAEL